MFKHCHWAYNTEQARISELKATLAGASDNLGSLSASLVSPSKIVERYLRIEEFKVNTAQHCSGMLEDKKTTGRLELAEEIAVDHPE